MAWGQWETAFNMKACRLKVPRLHIPLPLHMSSSLRPSQAQRPHEALPTHRISATGLGDCRQNNVLIITKLGGSIFQGYPTVSNCCSHNLLVTANARSPVLYRSARLPPKISLSARRCLDGCIPQCESMYGHCEHCNLFVTAKLGGSTFQCFPTVSYCCSHNLLVTAELC